MTQSEIGAILGWSREKVSQYALLQKINSEAWKIIATTTDNIVAINENGVVAENATVVAIFSEGLLRSILPLTPSQQLDLVARLAKGDNGFDKKQFNNKAQTYKTRNEIRAYKVACCLTKNSTGGMEYNCHGYRRFRDTQRKRSRDRYCHVRDIL